MDYRHNYRHNYLGHFYRTFISFLHELTEVIDGKAVINGARGKS